MFKLHLTLEGAFIHTYIRGYVYILSVDRLSGERTSLLLVAEYDLNYAICTSDQI